ncbi:MAG: M23 family metallopeptidase, partial [Lachnospiraceae bacterium]|nr:M23 family metallopeptidase [Oscillospiraceae bacterium]
AVSAGEYVEKGQIVGYVGSTGQSTGNHLHFEVYQNGTRVDPLNFV